LCLLEYASTGEYEEKKNLIHGASAKKARRKKKKEEQSVSAPKKLGRHNTRVTYGSFRTIEGKKRSGGITSQGKQSEPSSIWWLWQMRWGKAERWRAGRCKRHSDRKNGGKIVIRRGYSVEKGGAAFKKGRQLTVKKRSDSAHWEKESPPRRNNLTSKERNGVETVVVRTRRSNLINHMRGRRHQHSIEGKRGPA